MSIRTQQGETRELKLEAISFNTIRNGKNKMIIYPTWVKLSFGLRVSSFCLFVGIAIKGLDQVG